ncbi:hypothetical protein M378DRAFT_740096 [Amanita muscaria Koide BX008]|uniref:Uncharacterized protein n=1 Tax=Amanita muscaria (strain Koide BX008) TaxID=946122 RepID=A0A0C2SL79_AMAMK|nr:hypothetical protein M378DRAFT_740096 [Amanita muscaria Koide BX008]
MLLQVVVAEETKHRPKIALFVAWTKVGLASRVLCYCTSCLPRVLHLSSSASAITHSITFEVPQPQWHLRALPSIHDDIENVLIIVPMSAMKYRSR